MRRTPLSYRPAFTLIELLVVVGVIGVIISILLPSLAKARTQSKLTVCGSNLRQIATTIHAYAMDQRGHIPVGPNSDMFPFPGAPIWNRWASNQVWIGSLKTGNALGVMTPKPLPTTNLLFCPDDNSDDIPKEMGNTAFKMDADAYCSYLYRQFDETTSGRLDNLGRNSLGLPANALALDVNSLGGIKIRVNHRAAWVNIVYRDGHAARFAHRKDALALRAQDYASFPVSIARRLDEILCVADYSLRGLPENTPPLP